MTQIPLPKPQLEPTSITADQYFEYTPEKLELIYDTIIAIQNQDLEIEIPAAMQTLTKQINTDWLIKSLT